MPIKLIVQREGFFIDAVEMGIKNAHGDIVLFMDDDAVAEREWIAKYLALFQKLKDAGGIAGLIFQISMKEIQERLKRNTGMSALSILPSIVNAEKRPLKLVKFYGSPLNLYKGYVNYVSKSGFLICKYYDEYEFEKENSRQDTVLSAVFVGANMGFRRDAIEDCPLRKFFRGSRKGYSNESFLAYWARRKGYNTYAALEPLTAPIVWHISHIQRLTGLSSKNPFFDKFWFGYDVLMNYFRYKSLGADVSFLRYIVAALAFIRKDPPPRLAALSYALLTLPRYLREIREQTNQNAM
jgi:GT2 family glycosyltransferase